MGQLGRQQVEQGRHRPGVPVGRQARVPGAAGVGPQPGRGPADELGVRPVDAAPPEPAAAAQDARCGAEPDRHARRSERRPAGMGGDQRTVSVQSGTVASASGARYTLAATGSTAPSPVRSSTRANGDPGRTRTASSVARSRAIATSSISSATPALLTNPVS